MFSSVRRVCGAVTPLIPEQLGSPPARPRLVRSERPRSRRGDGRGRAGSRGSRSLARRCGARPIRKIPRATPLGRRLLLREGRRGRGERRPQLRGAAQPEPGLSPLPVSLVPRVTPEASRPQRPPRSLPLTTPAQAAPPFTLLPSRRPANQRRLICAPHL